MDTFNRQIEQAACGCIRQRVPFCLYAVPGADSQVKFFSNPDGADHNESKPAFIVGMWNDKARNLLRIYHQLDGQATIKYLNSLPGAAATEPAIEPYEGTTSHSYYAETLQRLIEILRQEDIGKVVISRTASLPIDLEPERLVELAQIMFRAFPNSFRHLYYTPVTGFWMGASPELLASYDSDEGKLNTMALAGTRRADDFAPDAPWGEKDRREQAIVTHYIDRELSALGFTVECSEPRTLSTGNLQHICTGITAHFEGAHKPSAETVIDALNPTPALCGYPKQRALELIDSIECHPRYCYGGIVGVQENSKVEAWVNLRCMHFSDTRACIYAGGGILAQSDPEAEWLEAERKMQGMAQLVERLSKTEAL